MSKIILIVYKYGVPLDDPCCYPLGFMYVSALLKSIGHEVKVLNYNLWDYDLEEEIKGYDIAGFTGYEEFKNRILRDEKICTEHGLQTTIGGALATFNAIPEFKGSQVKGEILKQNIYDTVFPDYEGFGIQEYHKRHIVRYMGVLTSIGCPYKCTFCAQTCTFRYRNLKTVMAEVDYYINQYKCDHIIFNDNTINVTKKRFMKICSYMKGRKVQWSAAIRCAPFDNEMAIAAKNSGCFRIVIGVESFDQRKLNRVNKKIKVWQIVRTLDLLEKYDIDYQGNILVGFEGETVNDIQYELSLIPPQYKLYPMMVQPFIGTKNGKVRGISQEKYTQFSQDFKQHIEEAGKYCFEVKNVG